MLSYVMFPSKVAYYKPDPDELKISEDGVCVTSIVSDCVKLRLRSCSQLNSVSSQVPTR